MKNILYPFSVLIATLFVSHSALANYNLSCKPEGRSAYLLEILSNKFWSKKATINVVKKSNKEVVASYDAIFDGEKYEYVFGDKNEYSVSYDEVDHVGIDESGPFDITAIFGSAEMKEVSGPLYCYQI